MFLSGGVWSIAMAGVAGAQRAGWFPSWGDPEGRKMLREALSTGELPPGARPDAWRRLVRQDLDDARQGRWFAGLFMALVAVLVAVAAVLENDNAWTLWVLAVGLAAFIAVPVRSLSRRAERAQKLLARLDAAQSG
jgi:hypothetical protein